MKPLLALTVLMPARTLTVSTDGKANESVWRYISMHMRTLANSTAATMVIMSRNEAP
jgi:hypothetical protein